MKRSLSHKNAAKPLSAGNVKFMNAATSGALQRSMSTIEKSTAKKIPSDSWQPNKWKEMWDGIQKHRRQTIAPVDQLGAESLINEKDLPDAN